MLRQTETATQALLHGRVANTSKDTTSPCCRAPGEEIGSIADNWPNENDDPAVTHFGPHASEDVFKAEASGKRFIHLATHGYFMQGQCGSSRGTDENNATGGTLQENSVAPIRTILRRRQSALSRRRPGRQE